MILQRLAEHYDRIAATGDNSSQLVPPGFSLQKISFCVVLEPDGRLNSFQSMQEQRGRALVATPMLLPGQGKPSGQGLNPCFLWDSAAYMLGWSADKDKRDRAAVCFEAFRNMHLGMEEQIESPAFSAVCSFLREWTPERALEFADDLAKCATNFGVFRIAREMQYVHELIAMPPVRNEAEASRPADEYGMCLALGVYGPIARLHEPKIKGVAGAQSAGALLVSFNAPAYESYGKFQSFNGPVSPEVVFKYANALNYLLSRRDRRVSLGDSTVVFWADHANLLESCLSEIFSDTLPDDGLTVEEDKERVRQARLLLTQLRDGTGETEIYKDDGQPTKFFLLGLSPNASRISVRLWVEADAAELQRRLGQHLRDIALADKWNEEILTLQRIVRGTGRAERDPKGRLKGFNTENISPQLAGDLARCVLTGAAYPQSLLATMLRRVHSDGEVTYARVAAIKACLVRNSRLRGNPLEVSVMLDPNSTDPAYCCGRAFALLEVIQKDSVDGDLNKTIKDSYFSSASATPSLIFPRLCRLSQHHLAKLETGQRIYREKQLGEVLNKLAAFPRLLSLEDQGKFVLGYFHQTRDIYTPRKDKEEGADQ